MSHSNYFAIAVLIGLATTFTSCSHDEIYSSSEKSKVSLTLHHFGIEQDAITRASASQDPHRIVFKAFDSLGDVAYETVQVSGQEGFGALDFELSPGSYTFVTVAHDVALLSTKPEVLNPDATIAASIDSPSKVTMPEALVEDTFCDMLNATIKPKVPFSASMALPRVVSRFEIIMSDAIPAGTKTLKITANTVGEALSGNASFNPSTNLALADWKYVKEADISSAVNIKGAGLGLHLFLKDEEQTIDVIATAYDTEGKEIISHTLKNVPMKRNRTTRATGKFFTEGATCTFTFSTDWDSRHNVSY